MKHRPVVTDFRIRPPTYRDGHWLNRFWGPLARGLMVVVGRVPFYRYILRAHKDAEAVLWSGEPAIFVCIHQDIFDTFNGLPRLLQDRPLAAMVSLSRDGGLGAIGLRLLGYEVIRGSSSRGGGAGLMALHHALRGGTSVVMACDGPKAPLGDVKPGAVRLAASTQAPVLPVRAWGLNRYRFHGSWAKPAVTLPFMPVSCCIGAPIRVPAEVEDPRAYQLAIAQSIASLARWASYWANGPYTSPFTVAEG